MLNQFLSGGHIFNKKFHNMLFKINAFASYWILRWLKILFSQIFLNVQERLTLGNY
jgi:hypothetical protein